MNQQQEVSQETGNDPAINQVEYFDLQVNGFGGVDFNQDDLSEDQLNQACEHLRAAKVGGILATIITEDIDKMAARIARLVELRQSSELTKRMIAGIHIEGPFLNPESGYIGAHPADAAIPATAAAAAKLVEAGDGLVKLFTLSPECDADMTTTKWLSDEGITVSAGHTNATADQLDAAIGAGLRMFTHLGNGCPKLLDRHDNIIQRVLHVARLVDDFTVSFIADGVHIPFPALSNYVELLGSDKCIMVTDAISAAGLGAGSYQLGRLTIEIGDAFATESEDGTHLTGSAATMPIIAKNLQQQLDMDEADIEWLLNINPRRIVGC